MAKKELTEKQRAFVEHFCRHRNGSRAARQAGYSVASAHQIAWELRYDPKYAHVQEMLRKRLAQEREKWEHTHETLIEQAMHIATFDPVDLVDEDGQYRRLQDIDPEARAALAEVRETEFLGPDGEPQVTRKYRSASKMEAINFLGKATGLVRDRVEHGGTLDIREARARLEQRLASSLESRDSLLGGIAGAEPGGEAASSAEPEPGGPA